eukprot:GEMP01004545.1.p1 GENE.GEMP01004545.1~~GEMP01004545.1.p1  ORF type:complete len:420 (+),score=139.51 GEMP01004545.1:785-2044(+)
MGPMADTICYNSALAALARTRQWQHAAILVERMECAGVEKTAITLNTAIRAHELANEHEKGIALLMRFNDSVYKADRVRQTPSMRASTRPNAITPELRRQVAERLEHRVLATALAPPALPTHARNTNLLRSTIVTSRNVHAALSLPPFADLLPTDDERRAHNDALRSLNAAVPWPDCTVVPFGSHVMGLQLRGGDLDLSLEGPLPYTTADARTNAQQTLLEWRPTLLSVAREATFHLGGKMPVAALVLQNGVHVDVSVHNTLGIRKSEFVRSCLASTPAVQDDIVRLKQWAKQENLLGQTRGRIGGYTFTLMALFTAQIHTQEVQQHERALPFLPFFFYFYTSEFDWQSEAVSVRLGRRSFAPQPADTPHAARLCVEDPMETSWDLGALLAPDALADLRASLARGWEAVRAHGEADRVG